MVHQEATRRLRRSGTGTPTGSTPSFSTPTADPGPTPVADTPPRPSVSDVASPASVATVPAARVSVVFYNGALYTMVHHLMVRYI